MSSSPADKPILITGCSSGIGHCVAHGLQARGYTVIASARKMEDVMKLRAEGLTAVRLDLADSASITAAVEETLALTGGRLYALFNNGAYGQPGAVEDLRREVLRAQFETNLFGTLELTNQIIPVMRRQGYGRIIMNSSVLGLVTLRYRGAYTATKFALEGISDALRMELRGSGIHVALIEPGPIRSRFRANAYAAYLAHIERENSAHRDVYRRMEARLTKAGNPAPFTRGPEAVLAKVLHALEAARPRPRYYVTVPTYLFGVLRRLAGTRLLDWVLQRVSRGENR
jgi:NAD(P)-dependent dehydrogenase (short-subunit alcohol dehydrogenase family)